MLAQRMLWGGGTITSAVMAYLAFAQVQNQLARWAFGLVFGLLFIASMTMFPWGQNDDGSTRRLINVRSRGRNNVTIATGDESPMIGNVVVSGKGTVHQHGLTTEQLSELKKHVDDQVAGEVELYVDRRMEVFKIDVAKNQGQAYDRAMLLAQQVLTSFVEQLAAKAPENIASVKTVAMQQAILNAQTSAAIADDNDLTETLVDILVDKSGAEPRSFKGVVLTQALDVAGKLTADQVNLLTAIVIINYTVHRSAKTEEYVFNWLDAQCRPLYGKIPTINKAIEYMTYTGVGSFSPRVDSETAESIISRYDTVFTRGFDVDALRVKIDAEGGMWDRPDAEQLLTELIDGGLVIRANHGDPNHVVYRFNLASSQYLKNMPPHLEMAVRKLITDCRIAKITFRRKVELAKPDLASFLGALDDISAPSFRLSTVGIALGQANWRRLQPETAPSIDIYLH